MQCLQGDFLRFLRLFYVSRETICGTKTKMFHVKRVKDKTKNVSRETTCYSKRWLFHVKHSVFIVVF